MGALVARAEVRLGQSFLTDLPFVLIAVAGFTLTLPKRHRANAPDRI